MIFERKKEEGGGGGGRLQIAYLPVPQREAGDV